jgi:hypothetical protein
MQLWMVALGLLVLVVTVTDALTTTVAAGTGGGPITSRVGQAVWWAGRGLARRPDGLALRVVGPAVAAATAVTWVVGVWLGWFLVLSASPEAVVSDPDGVPADGWTRLYFAGFTVFTLGLGDFAPAGSPWQIVTVLGAASGLMLTTLAITFLMPVVTAVTERRQQSQRIAALGEDAQEVLVAAWDGSGFGSLLDRVADLASDLTMTAERQLSYPILGRFHSPEATAEHRVQLVLIDEVVTLLRHGVDHDEVHVDPVPLRLLRHATRRQLERSPTGPRDDLDPPALDLSPLRAAGIPTVDDAAFERSVTADLDHRRHLVAAAEASLWPWRSVVRERAGR